MLRQVTAVDVPWLLDGLRSWQRTRRWSCRGTSPSPVQVERLLADETVARAAVWRDDRPVAVIEIVDDNPRHHTAELAFMADPHHVDHATVAAGSARSAGSAGSAQADDTGPALLFPEVGQLLGEARARRPELRKLSVWACDDEADVPLLLGAGARPCGRLAAHERRRPDEFVDVVVYEMWLEGDRR